MITRRQANVGILANAAAAATPRLAAAQEAQAITLPSPRNDGGEPLLRALKLRRSTREYSDRKLPPQVLSDLLWAAFGINRPSGDRTAGATHGHRRLCINGRRRLAVRGQSPHLAAASVRGHSCSDRASGLCRHRATLISFMSHMASV
jgi:hypothetical protein